MKNLSVQLTILAALIILAPQAAGAGCLPFPMRNYSLEAKGPSKFESRNGEFDITLPFKKQKLDFGSFGDKCFYAINIDAIGQTGHYSIEWVYLDKAVDGQRFLSYWDSFLADYLAKNFGKGNYQLLFSSKSHDPSGRDVVYFIGTGVGNNGAPGSIYGRSTNFGERMATVYSITDTPIEKSNATLDAPEMTEVKSFADSVKCKSCRP